MISAVDTLPAHKKMRFFMCKITMKSFKAAEKGLFGNISAIAKKLGVSRKTLYRFLANTPEAAECIASAREEFDDIAEENIRKKNHGGRYFHAEILCNNKTEKTRLFSGRCR